VVGISLVAGFSLAAVLFLTARVVRTNAVVRAADDLQAARAAFHNLVDDRVEAAAAQIRLITELPVFRAHMTDVRLAGDAATLQEMADGYRRALGARFLLVTDAAGAPIAGPPWLGEGPLSPELARGIDAGRQGRSHRAVVPIDQQLNIVVTEPATFASEVLGTVTVGYPLDDVVARELSRTTRCEVSMIWNDRISGSSLAPALRGALAAELTGDARTLGRLGQAPALRPLGRMHYVSGVYPLETHPSDSSVGTLVLLQDWQPTQTFVDEIQSRVIWLGGITFLFALAGGVLLSRRVTRPLKEVAAVAQDIAAGRWDRRVPTRGQDEATAMATAFNEMTETLTHWHAEAQHRESQLRHSQKMDAIGQLAGGVAHDFNNLLMAIHGYGELLLMSLPPDDRRRDDVQQILRTTESAGALTRQLLAFSRKQILAPKVVHLGHIVTGTEKMLRRLIDEDIELAVHVDPDLWSVRADPGQIEQVIMNLVVNARDAMPTGGQLTINLANVTLDSADSTYSPAISPGTYVRITVRDTGCGIDAETLLHIFEPFFTTKEAGRGTGLGLAMVYGIVQQSGGSIAVESELNRGTIFRIVLPRADREPEMPVEERPVTLPRERAETVLLAEDDTLVRKFAREVLNREGYSVIEAARGDEALELASRTPGPIHLLLTDVVMPGMNGRALWEKLSAHRSETRVLFMSGYTDDAVVRRGVGDDGLPFLQKPFTFVALAREVRRVLGRDETSVARR
jgi:signal transduction histidine kinase/ActR/RegA family two-component response regulator